MNNIKIANLNVKLKDLFFRWLDVTKSFHKLNNQQQQVLALFLYYHFLYKKEITNDKILWKILFDYDTKLKIKEDDIFKKGLSDNSLQNILTSLRKKKIIIDGKISPVFIPELSIDSKNFKVVFNFNIVDNEK
jgi:uncharacterized surface anchored protein